MDENVKTEPRLTPYSLKEIQGYLDAQYLQTWDPFKLQVIAARRNLFAKLKELNKSTFGDDLVFFQKGDEENLLYGWNLHAFFKAAERNFVVRCDGNFLTRLRQVHKMPFDAKAHVSAQRGERIRLFNALKKALTKRDIDGQNTLMEATPVSRQETLEAESYLAVVFHFLDQSGTAKEWLANARKAGAQFQVLVVDATPDNVPTGMADLTNGILYLVVSHGELKARRNIFHSMGFVVHELFHMHHIKQMPDMFVMHGNRYPGLQFMNTRVIEAMAKTAQNMALYNLWNFANQDKLHPRISMPEPCGFDVEMGMEEDFVRLGLHRGERRVFLDCFGMYLRRGFQYFSWNYDPQTIDYPLYELVESNRWTEILKKAPVLEPANIQRMVAAMGQKPLSPNEMDSIRKQAISGLEVPNLSNYYPLAKTKPLRSNAARPA